MALAIAGRKQVKVASLLQQAARSYAGYWNHEWRPSVKLPKTPEEKRMAAKKYNLIPEDYKNYPDDGTGFGDYPKFEPVSAESRDPFQRYDFPEMKRNYGEPLHLEADLYGEDRLDVSRRLPYPLSWMIWSFLGCMAGATVLFGIGEYFKYCGVKIMRRHYPNDGKPHYSFDVVEKVD